jgi:hypothetical protein
MESLADHRRERLWLVGRFVACRMLLSGWWRGRGAVATGESGGVFISYRRQDTIHSAGRLYDRLADRLGDDQVFMDVARIGVGIDFAEAITQAVSACQVLLAVIGPAWLTATDEQGRRRLDDPKDFVRLEIQAALDRDIRVIPILVSGAKMPRADQLPRRLAKLARRNAITMHDDIFPEDAERLLTKIEPLLEVTMAAAPGSPLAHGMLGRPLRQVVANPVCGLCGDELCEVQWWQS